MFTFPWNHPLEDPLKTLNIVVRRGNDEQQLQQIAQMQTVEEDVFELFADIVEDKVLQPPSKQQSLPGHAKCLSN